MPTLYAKLVARLATENPGWNMWPVGAPHFFRKKSPKNLLVNEADAPPALAVGARNHIRLKLMIDPTISVANTKSSSWIPQSFLLDMSPSTEAPTPIICSVRTLKTNSGSAFIRSLNPAASSANGEPPPPPPPPPPPVFLPQLPEPPFPPEGG